MRIEQRAAKRDRMHDRKDPGLVEIRPFGRPRVIEQPPDLDVALDERTWFDRMKERIDVTVDEGTAGTTITNEVAHSVNQPGAVSTNAFTEPGCAMA